MREPQYSREVEITVANFSNDSGGVSLSVGVCEGRVHVSMDMDWSCPPSSVGRVCEALQSAAILAAQWTERDQRIADLMRRRRENSHLWYEGVNRVVSTFRGVLQTPFAQKALSEAIQHKRAELAAQFGGAEIPEFSVQYLDGGVTIEPIWDRMPQFRWVEP